MTVPILSVEGGLVGDALTGQRRPTAQELTAKPIADCGHLVSLEQPDALAAAPRRFVPRPA